jgi:hypothetical protein
MLVSIYGHVHVGKYLLHMRRNSVVCRHVADKLGRATGLKTLRNTALQGEHIRYRNVFLYLQKRFVEYTIKFLK